MERDAAAEWLIKCQDDFNSHAHVERDALKRSARHIRRISTHTLTWSVTVYVDNYKNKDGISTHTLTWSVTA